ncbi:NAD(P)H-binding protein [Nocardioides sp. LHD-245]|uniref:NAD(P)-dependent oxidoreductase n=1 Tax=Nocardioides sp. LHD-245 TaxID=3051387 RepID=UPI0027E191EF|nr:NAD(P)H-binding protein [Nocardioides sp. LHD-245]
MAATKRIVVIGARGRAGSAAVAEAVARGHEVTAVVRDPAAYEAPADVTVRAGDITDPATLAATVSGQDAVIAAVYDASSDPAVFLPAAAQGLAEVVGSARLVWVGLASLLPDATGTPLMDTFEYPQEYRSFYLSHLAALDVLRASGLGWVAISPSGDFDHGGAPTGGYQLAPGDAAARITYADHAIALVDEAVDASHHQTHLGVVAQA